MRYFICGAAGAFTLHWIGLNFWLGAVIGLIAAIAVSPKVSTKRVIIEDITTGEINIQPNDRATQRYIQGRGK